MTMNTLPISANLNTEAGLNQFIQAVNALPMLSAKEEKALAVRYKEQGDLDAAKQLIMSQLRAVVRIARGFKGYGLPQADLIQEGNIGLMKAVKGFDPERGVRLVSFAVHWIKAEMYDYILRNWRIVKVATTKAQRKLFFNLRKLRAHTGWMNQKEVENLANKLNVKEKTVLEMEGRLGNRDTPFDAPTDDDEIFQASPAGYLQDMRYNPEELVIGKNNESDQKEQIGVALALLDERSRDIIKRRWLDEDKPTLHKLAAEYNISAERIRQIEKKALSLMKDHIVA